jgi:hypothetical protein
MMLEHFHPVGDVEIVDNFLQHPADVRKQLLHRIATPIATTLLALGARRLAQQLVAPLYPARYLQTLRQLSPGDAVLVFDVTNPRTLRFILRWLPRGVKFHDFFHNPMVPNAPLLCNKTLFRALQQEGIHFSTFDPEDARTFGMPYYGQFYFRPDERELTAEIKYDFFFCGLPKDRESELLRLQHYLEESGYKCRFVFPHTVSERLSPQQYIDILRSSRCVIDMNQSGQTGLSRRPLEALFYKKKLITNNPTLKDYPFYRPSNILIVTHETTHSEFLSFISTPMEEIPASVTAPYEMNQWIEHFRG